MTTSLQTLLCSCLLPHNNQLLNAGMTLGSNVAEQFRVVHCMSKVELPCIADKDCWAGML